MPEHGRSSTASSLTISLPPNAAPDGQCSMCGGGGFRSLDPVVFRSCVMGKDCGRAHSRIQDQSNSGPSAEWKPTEYRVAADSACPGVVRAKSALNPTAQVELPSGPEQIEPQSFPILQLHRHNDGYVVFSSKNGDDMADRRAVRIDELQTYFSQFRQQFLKDSFVGINADWRLAHGKGPCGYPSHPTDGLRYLCACYVDLDYYKLGLEFGEVYGTLIS